MAVTARSSFASSSAVVVNSSIDASQLVADRFCAMYGIPLANQKAFAMGTAREWAYSATRFADFYAPLAAHLTSIGANAVFCAAGCPITISVFNHTTEANIPGTSTLSFPLMVSVVKRINVFGYEPRSYISGSVKLPTVKFPADVWVPGNIYTLSSDVLGTPINDTEGVLKESSVTNWYTNIIEATTDPDYETAITTVGGTYTDQSRSFNKYLTATPTFNTKDTLPCGWIGWWDGHETDPRDASGTYSTNIWDRSRIILGKAANATGKLASIKDRKVLVAIWGYDGTPSTSQYFMGSKWALIVKKLVDLGFTDVDYWYTNPNTEVAMYNLLAPIAGGKQEVGVGDWTTANLNATTAEAGQVVYSYGFGFGFGNGGAEVTWAPYMKAESPHGLFIGGASSNSEWAAKLQTTDLGHSAIVQPYMDTGGRHATAKTIRYEIDSILALLEGRTLAEASYLCPEFYAFPIGDPLYRMVVP